MGDTPKPPAAFRCTVTALSWFNPWPPNPGEQRTSPAGIPSDSQQEVPCTSG